MKTIKQIESDVVNYFAGCGLDDCYTDRQREIIAMYNKEWDDVEVDPEGATPEQDKELDGIIEKCAQEVFNLQK